jgi:hypothetical protein
MMFFSLFALHGEPPSPIAAKLFQAPAVTLTQELK